MTFTEFLEELRSLREAQVSKVVQDQLEVDPRLIDQLSRDIGYRDGYADALEYVLGGLEELLED